MNYKYIICHYGEIGLKGDNKNYFEKKLVDNIKEVFERELPGSFKAIKIISCRVLIELTSMGVNNIKIAIKALARIFGLVNFSPAVESTQEPKELSRGAWELIKEKEFTTFRISARRSDKNLKLNSREYNEIIGAYIVERSGKKVKLKNPGLNCRVELVNKRAFIYTEKIKGSGGMPVGSAGRVAILLSGGIDSPIAAYYALKRGCAVIFIHFHSLPFTTNESIEKVKKLAGVLKKYGARGRIYMVPFAEAQKQVLVNAPEKLRVIFYRRLMLKIAEIIAEKENCLALVTGESLGQVASQTLENITVIEEAVVRPVLRPLIGFDKQEIMEIARRIGTYDISILPHDDCCTRFIPKHPETRAKLFDVTRAEAELDIKKIINKAIEKTKITEI